MGHSARLIIEKINELRSLANMFVSTPLLSSIWRNAQGIGAAALLGSGLAPGFQWSVFAQPAIVSISPTNGATGVSVTTPFIVTFNTPMHPLATYVNFSEHTSGNAVIPNWAWNTDTTILTNTPAPAWPANKQIDWSITGFDPTLFPLLGTNKGSFTVGGGGGSGLGTNKITTFTVGKTYYYDQTTAGSPFLDHTLSDGFGATTTLASNRTAITITVTVPTSATNTLAQDSLRAEVYGFMNGSTNNSAFDLQYPSGNYVFNVQASSSNQQVTVNLPSTMAQPPVPHVSNFTAAQSVDPTQPFTLTWDAFSGGTVNDFMSVQIGTNFTTPTLGSTGALSGTATSVVIPANILPPSRFLSSCYLTFYHYAGVTNSSYATLAYRATSTQFFMYTTAASTIPLVLTNGTPGSNGIFSFAITSSAGQAITVVYSDTLRPGSWSTLLTTNSPGGRVLISDPGSPGSSHRWYRAQEGL
jgi:hypothetical protein